MNKLILDMIVKRLKKTDSKLLISSISYYAFLAIIPTIIFSISIVKFFNLDIDSTYLKIIDIISINPLSNTLIFFIVTYMISRIFYVILRKKFKTLKSLLFSFLFSFVLIFFFVIFFTLYRLNIVLSLLFKFILVFILLFLILHISSEAKLKYSLLFSLSFSLVINTFLYLFSIVSYFFIDYNQYYGIFAPIFLSILTIHLTIYIVYIAYICAEEFTKISNIKILKK